jgi:Type II restriction endonuclease EcoO109I
MDQKVMNAMKQSNLEELIRKSLEDFHIKRINGLSTLKLRTVLRKKNPYLFRAVGVQKASEIVSEILRAHVTSSDETIFGNAFFEPIAQICSGGRTSDSEGVDVTVETETVYKAIAVKSGPNIFNSSAAKRQDQEFRSLASRLLKIHKRFDPLLGLGYGRRFGEPTKDRSYRIRSGQAFWEELTGDSDFYLKLIDLMRDYPIQHRIEFEKEWGKAINRFEYDFLINFGNEDGSINWEKLLIFNSGKEKPRWIKVTATTVVEEQDDSSEDIDDLDNGQEEA